MESRYINKEVEFYDLEWDTNFFDVKSAKAILHLPLEFKNWEMLKNKFENYQFITIQNQNSEPINSHRIGRDTNAMLVDVNIQFEKDIKKSETKYYNENIIIKNALEKNDQIFNLADFTFSRFLEDPELSKRGGKRVYEQWIENSFGEKDKFFALSKNNNGDLNGFVLYSYRKEVIVIELIAVSAHQANSGIGSKLFKSVEVEALKNGCSYIKVGTQIRNTSAINFYHKMGCRQVGCNQVFHLWKS